MKLIVYSRIARARGLAQAIAESRADARLEGIREGAAEIAELLDIQTPELVADAKSAVRVSVSREPDDPQALRASIGGNREIGYYLEFRGDPEEVLDMLRAVLPAAEAMLPVDNYRDQR